MAKKRTNPPANTAAMKAIADIKSLLMDQADPKSLEDIANALRTRSDFAKVAKSTIGHWLAYKAGETIPRKTEHKIIRAAEYLKETIEMPVILKIGVIDHATEMLPAHLIARYEQWQKDQVVRVEIEKLESIKTIISSLESGDIDFGIAPRSSVREDNPTVKRFIQISSVKASGLFAFDQTDGGSLKHAVEETLVMEGGDIGLLPNANYESVLEGLFSAQKPKMLKPKFVLGHDDALTKLKAGEISAVLGHSVFIANFQKTLRLDPAGGVNEQASLLEKLKKADPVTFGERVEMHVFINRTKITAEAARRGFLLFYQAVHCMAYARDSHMIEEINRVLGLNKDDAMSGLAVLNEFDYAISDVNPNVLNDLWKG